MLILGEVHTGLLRNSLPMPARGSERLLGMFRGEAVRWSERPISYAASPDSFTGVDCRLATGSGTRVRGIGTVASRVALTGGRILQGSVIVQVTRAAASHREVWSHYLATPGRIEIIGKADPTDLVAGFAAPEPDPSTLDLGAISGDAMDAVQASPHLDQRPPLRAGRTRLRWAALPGDGPGRGGEPDDVWFAIEGSQLRTIRLCGTGADPTAIAGLCEDLALHDWLLTTMLVAIERSQAGDSPHRSALDRLRPAVEHLLHLWMPAARLADPQLLAVWERLERRAGFSRQWQALVGQVRDQIALRTIALLGARTGGERG